MARKNFKDNLSGKKYMTVVNQKSEGETTETKADKPKPENSTNLKYKPHTFKIREDVLLACQAMAWWERETFQDFFTKVLSSYMDSKDPRELEEIVAKYQKSNK